MTDTESSLFLEILSDGTWNVDDIVSTGTYELAAVPEPGTALLLAAGLTGLAARRRSRSPRR